MAFITYTAKDRGFLISGHSALSSYNLEFEINAYDEGMNIANVTQEAVDGTSETLLSNVQLNVSATATWLTDDDRLQFREFISSMAAGESFSFDPYGTVAVPSSTLYTDCRLTSNRITPNRTTSPGINQRFDVSLTFIAAE